MKSSKIKAQKRQLELFLVIAGLAVLISPAFIVRSQSTSDAALNAVRASDQMDRAGKSKVLTQVSAAEHMRRAGIYMANRAFAPAREHWQAVLAEFPNDTNVPAAIYGIARSYYQERHYEEARQMYERVARDYPETKEGREGANFAASALLRMGKGAEAAARYAQYLDKYPNGERVDTAHLNIVDGYREAGRPQDAILWIDRTRQKFAGTPTETSAIFARLRLDVTIGDWNHAVQSADELLQKPINKASNTTADEVLYLKAHALERAGRIQDAARFFSMIPDGLDSYWGGLATNRLAALNDATAKQRANERARSVQAAIDRASSDYPSAFGAQVVREAKKRALDPRLLLAIMKQESQFKPTAK